MLSDFSAIDWFPLWLSLRVACLATAISLAVGLTLAYVLANRRFRGRNLVEAAVTLPIVLPPTVLGFYLLIVLGRNSPLGGAYETLFGVPLVFTWQAAVVAACLHSIPLLIRAARAAFESVDHTFENAARSLGATEWRVFWKVSLPLARRSIVAAGVFAFARALGDFGVTMMIAGNIPGSTQTMAVAIYDAVQSGQTRVANVLVIVMSALALTILWVMNQAGERQAR
ncbi:MAG: molybdate ABC transporter permease subunit [Acidobacteria bacterium]|nr:molybdate ABC transporter permease subunit [Acidobacteriota bacterium]